ncbi:MAG: hypothetical protein K0Q51_116 [Rickettsiaceae bacterium]|jgi:putative SOS response-associated peptidase YedK|nr:hypothetical protein [Rickettsiaceae bacterium]
MCGRFTVTLSDIALETEYGITNNVELKPNYNVTPLSNIPVIIKDEKNDFKLQFMHWGLIPHWSKDISISHKLINARAETLQEKPSFKKSFQSKRCIIPASGFYEWKKETKQPYYIKPKEGFFSFAGLWDQWKSSEGQIINSCTIITTEANDALKNIHHRMPVIISREDRNIWFDSNAGRDELKTLLHPYTETNIECIEVSKRVNSPSNNDASLINPLYKDSIFNCRQS